MSAFLEALAYTKREEGVYSDDPNDPGNWTGGRKGQGELRGTKYGISAKAYPHLDIKNLTLGEAREIYLNDYWRPIKGDELPRAWRISVFDTAVNVGVPRAVRMMQDALGVMVDGSIGARTISAAASADNRKLARFYARRAKWYTELDTFDGYWDGWFTRCFVMAMEAEEG